jgi:D-alanyl-D-alanine carboxypeptidase
VIEDGEGGNYAYGLWQETFDGRTWIAHTGGMVGYTALLAVSPEDGLGIVMLQNGAGAKYGIAPNAMAMIRASLAGQELPTAWIPPAATAIPAAADYAGRFLGDDGREMTVAPTDDGLGITLGPLFVRLERDPLTRDPGESFLVAHPALDRFSLEFVRDADGTVIEAFHGGTWFRKDGVAAEAPSLPEAWRGYPGLYRNDDPWSPALRIVERKGALALLWPASAGDEDSHGALLPLGDGIFAVGEKRDPCRVRFEGEAADGRAVVVVYNEGRWYRSFED